MASRIDRMALAPYAQRSALFSISILIVDLAVYAGMVYGAITADAVWLKLLFSFGAGTMIAFAAIGGHDAGHQSFSNSKRVNRFFGTIAFLPALHPFFLWEHYHNRVHHRFTAQLGVDNAFPPMTVDQYREASPWRRARYRFIRSVWGQPFFYLIEVWVPDMLLPFLKKEPAMTRRVWFDLILVYAYFAAFIAGCTYLSWQSNGGSLWDAALNAIVFGFAIPYLIWNVFISFLSIVQHTGPDVRWSLPTGQPSTIEQALAGTVHAALPAWLDLLFHRIMQHQAHHIHVGIPMQHLKAAQTEVAEANGGKLVQVWTPAYHWRLTRECKLYDIRRNRWVGFDAADAEAGRDAQDLAA
jgi:acyl-lipid omega-6 desaturase (Delta-12 desaturase)